MTRKIVYEDIPDCPFVEVFVIDDKGDLGEDIIASAIITNDEAKRMQRKSDSELTQDMDRKNPKVEKKSLGNRKRKRD